MPAKLSSAVREQPSFEVSYLPYRQMLALSLPLFSQETIDPQTYGIEGPDEPNVSEGVPATEQPMTIRPGQ
jgi:hypothetical protein